MQTGIRGTGGAPGFNTGHERGENSKLEPTSAREPVRSGWTHKAAHHVVWSNHAAAGDRLSLDIHYATWLAVRPKSIPSTVRIATRPVPFLPARRHPARLARPAAIAYRTPDFDTSPRVF